MSIEVHNGKVVMSCDLGDNQLFRAETQFISKFALCDNQWHNISALYETSQIVIRIDNQPSIIQFAPNRSIGKVQTKSSLYIGGLPGNYYKEIHSIKKHLILLILFSIRFCIQRYTYDA